MGNNIIDWEQLESASKIRNIGKESFALATKMRDELFPYSLKLKICSKIPFIGELLVKDILQDSQAYKKHEIEYHGKKSKQRKMAIDMFLTADPIVSFRTSHRAINRLFKDLCSSSAV